MSEVASCPPYHRIDYGIQSTRSSSYVAVVPYLLTRMEANSSSYTEETGDYRLRTNALIVNCSLFALSAPPLLPGYVCS